MKEFKEIVQSPIEGLELSSDYPESFKESLNDNDDLLWGSHDVYEGIRGCELKDIKALRDWLNDVIEYCEENLPKVSFEEAKAHMEKGGKATFQTYDYCFNEEEVLCFINDDGIPQETIVTKVMLNAKTWVLKHE